VEGVAAVMPPGLSAGRDPAIRRSTHGSVDPAVVCG